MKLDSKQIKLNRLAISLTTIMAIFIMGCTIQAPQLDTPKGFTTQGKISTQVTVKWKEVFGADYYVLSIKKEDEEIARYSITNADTYTVKNLDPDTQYSFLLKACLEEETLTCSEESELTIKTEDPPQFSISYPHMDSTTSFAQAPAINYGVIGNCINKNANTPNNTYTVDKNTPLTYSIGFVFKQNPPSTFKIPGINEDTGEVSNTVDNKKASPGVYEVTVTAKINNNVSCSINTLFYNTITPANKSELEAAIQQGTNFYGNTGNFNYILTHEITDMSGLFAGSYNQFNGNITEWSTSNVTNMNRMFYYAAAFNQDLSEWTVDKVDSHVDMFTGSGMVTQTKWHPPFNKN